LTPADSELLRQAAADIDRERAKCQHELDTADGPFADRLRQIAQEQLERLETETPEGRLARIGERDEHREREERNRKRWQAWEALIEERGKRYETCRLQNYEITSPAQGEVVDRIRQYGDAIRERVNSGDGLLLIGPSGTGKDHLLIGLARIAVGADLAVRWTSGQKLFARVRQAIDADGETPGSVVRPFERTPILILSDLLPPSGRLTEYQCELVYRLIDERYNRLFK